MYTSTIHFYTLPLVYKVYTLRLVGGVRCTLHYRTTTLPGKKIGNTSRLLVYTSPAPLTLVRVRTGTYAYQKIRRRVSAIVRNFEFESICPSMTRRTRRDIMTVLIHPANNTRGRSVGHTSIHTTKLDVTPPIKYGSASKSV